MTQRTKDRMGGDEHPRPRLGRGLAALLADTTASSNAEQTATGREQLTVAVEFLRPNPRNPRRQFSQTDLADLTESIKANGIIQPIVVRAIRNVAGSYEIIAGERRWRAAQAAELDEVPVVVVEADDREALAFAIIENVQRADLNAIEEGRGYERLGEEFGYSQTDLAKIIGKSRSHVANTMRLLKLPVAVTDMVVDGVLSAGHARTLLAFNDPESMARRIVAEGLTVRDIEQLAQQEAQAPATADAPEMSAPRRTLTKTAESQRLARAFSSALGLPVSHSPKGAAGEIRIRYGSPEELATLSRRLGLED
ncbi:ParB/RepB/Spo0J family partition protein [Lichenihabitans psoromatis]|uniref:ParB/RepB/Spo0J family partition protein n=1 Tax=Lichenihabitans psoromatis TaxID=2528642 RepID=UPI001FDFDBD6|nr:ParB/RepB/Spo0J family partition protein [Lichenihabitans psoromatis]